MAAGLCATSAGAADAPLPERNPLRMEQAQPSAPPHPRERDAVAWTAQDIQAARDECAMMLDGSGVVYTSADPIREGVCGTPAPIELTSIGTSPQVRIKPPARVTCGLAASLATWSDTALQQAARKHFGRTVTSIRNVASYVCRNRYNAPDARISEHARANALDMAAFTLEGGEVITVLEHWNEMRVPAIPVATRDGEPPTHAPAGKPAVGPIRPDAPDLPEKPEASVQEPRQDAKVEPPAQEPTERARFLHEIHAGGCKLFGTVLGPLANEAHKDHFHFDLAPRKHSNYCE